MGAAMVMLVHVELFDSNYVRCPPNSKIPEIKGR